LRGKETDRKIGDIVSEVKQLAENGVKEICLLGQNVNTYGFSFRDKTAFSRLLTECSKIEGIDRIRFMSPHPAGFTDDVIEVIKENEKIMPQIHMPLQSGSDRILKAMRRGYDSARFVEVIEKIREARKDISISTDIIVGFPTESEEDFLQTHDLVKKIEFDLAYIFEYSKRPLTPAAEYDEQVDKDVVRQRFEKLLKMQEAITERKMQKFLGTKQLVLVSNVGLAKQGVAATHGAGGENSAVAESSAAGSSVSSENSGRRTRFVQTISGRDKYNHLIHIKKPDSSEIKAGDFVTVRITHAAPHHLLAELE
jgi:tRNA-2-methylthio-N6-dimethylallyladenosine synthase